MRRLFILLSFLSLINCKPQLKLGRYASVCYVTDAPGTILVLKKNSNFVLIYPGSVEQFSGIWSVKEDTLFLKSQYHNTLGQNDSAFVNEKEYFIIKRKKLISAQNKKCFLVLKKIDQSPK
ncbi:hypothetical protein CQ046_09330 [Chryseobacterium sp. MYb7]|uniref:hypothetical protein n=1 Tax=Chryseobacterium sp. MYb7 TaxID=1827290 RepID=UPI000CFF6EC2|nr:hypothetical protein [Chryseobacterium sp. MYb7]PRB03565.1 hypothetical protein CQ046_09330 [Chryseobacterium sp. MYb7]